MTRRIGSLSIGAEFVEAVEEGRKRTTLRLPRADGAELRVGETVALHCGPYRPGGRRRLGRVTIERVERIRVSRHGLERVEPTPAGPRWLRCPAEVSAAIAREDGFESFGDLVLYFADAATLPCVVNLYAWGELDTSPEWPRLCRELTGWRVRTVRYMASVAELEWPKGTEGRIEHAPTRKRIRVRASDGSTMSGVRLEDLEPIGPDERGEASS